MLIERFGEVFDDPMAELMKIQQIGSMEEYHEAFDCIISRLQLSDDHILSCFLGGLKKEIQMLVRMFQPNSVKRAFTLAKMYEASNFHSVTSATFVKQKLSTTNNKSLLGEKLMDSSSKNKGAENTTIRPGRSLSAAYMAEKRAKGLCYFCDEVFSLAHSQTHKNLT